MVVAAVIPVFSDKTVMDKSHGRKSKFFLNSDDDSPPNFGITVPDSDEDEVTDLFLELDDNSSSRYTLNDVQEQDSQEYLFATHGDSKSPPQTQVTNNLSRVPEKTDSNSQKYSWSSSLKSASDYSFSPHEEDVDAEFPRNTDLETLSQEKYYSVYFKSSHAMPDSAQPQHSTPEKKMSNQFPSKINSDNQVPKTCYSQVSESSGNSEESESDYNYFMNLKIDQDKISCMPTKDSSSQSPNTFYSSLLPSGASPQPESDYKCSDSSPEKDQSRAPSKIDSGSSSPETYHGNSRSSSPKPDSFFRKNEKLSDNGTKKSTGSCSPIKTNMSNKPYEGERTDVDKFLNTWSATADNYPNTFYSSLLPSGAIPQPELDYKHFDSSPEKDQSRAPCEIDSGRTSKIDSGSSSPGTYRSGNSRSSSPKPDSFFRKNEKLSDNDTKKSTGNCSPIKTSVSNKPNEGERTDIDKCLNTWSSAAATYSKYANCNSELQDSHIKTSNNTNIREDSDGTSSYSFGDWFDPPESQNIPENLKIHSDVSSDDSFGDWPNFTKERKAQTCGDLAPDSSFTQAGLESHLQPRNFLEKWLNCKKAAAEHEVCTGSSSKKKLLLKGKVSNKKLKSPLKRKTSIATPDDTSTNIISSSDTDDECIIKTKNAKSRSCTNLPKSKNSVINETVLPSNNSLDLPILKQSINYIKNNMDVNQNNDIKKKRKLFHGNMDDIGETWMNVKKVKAKEKRSSVKQSKENLIRTGREVARTRRIDEIFEVKDKNDESDCVKNYDLVGDTKLYVNSAVKSENESNFNEITKLLKDTGDTCYKLPSVDNVAASTITSWENEQALNVEETIPSADGDDEMIPHPKNCRSSPINYSMVGVSLKYLERRFFRNTRYLHEIFKGREHCWRHEQYKIGGEARNELRYATATNAYTDEQLNHLLNLLVKTFCHRGNTNFIDYFWKVLLPELATKIFMDKFKLSHKESLQKIHEMYISSKNECEQSE